MTVENIITMVLNYLYTYRLLIFVLIILIYVFFVVHYINISKRRAVLDNIFDEDKEDLKIEKTEKKTVSLFAVERFLYDKIGIKDYNKPAIYALRTMFVITCIAIFSFVRFAFIIIIADIFFIIKNYSTQKQIENNIGIDKVKEYNDFLTYYIQNVNGGVGIQQTMKSYCSLYGDDDLVEYLYSTKSNPPIPKRWEDEIHVYKDGLYSEENGLPDKAEFYQKDSIRKIRYFEKFQEAMSECATMANTYYISVPVLLGISMMMDDTFWSQIYGLITSIGITVAFFVFDLIITIIKKDKVKKIF